MIQETKLLNVKQPTTEDEAMIQRVLEVAHRAIADGKVGVASLLRWRGEIIAIAHNLYVETGDLTAHAEMVVLRQAAKRLNQISEVQKAELTLYTTLEPCLMCLSAISFVGIKRVVYSALIEDSSPEDQVAWDIKTEQINNQLVRGSLELVPGVKREEGKELLALMGKRS